jgi:hypothetical protein
MPATENVEKRFAVSEARLQAAMEPIAMIAKWLGFLRQGHAVVVALFMQN